MRFRRLAVGLAAFFALACADGAGPVTEHARLWITRNLLEDPGPQCRYAEYVAHAQAPATDTLHVILKWLNPGSGAGAEVLAPLAFRVDPGMTQEMSFLVATWYNTALLLVGTTSLGVSDSVRVTVMGPADFQAWIDNYPACAWLAGLL